ncbi:hypothetical protein ACTXIP_06530 [Psychrobacter alimentarius]|uniref:hypothetical protein n=1 Tax=Psychrobacter alimentarius TaxID=261164 RepID=UPI003FD5FE8B
MDKNKMFETRITNNWDHTDNFGIKRYFKVLLTGYYDDKERKIVIDNNLITSPSIDKYEDSYLYETIFNRMKFELEEIIKVKKKTINSKKYDNSSFSRLRTE